VTFHFTLNTLIICIIYIVGKTGCYIHHNLKAIVNHFITNGSWSIPATLIQVFPNLQGLIDKVTILVIAKDDKLVWTHSKNGELSFKEAYIHQCPIGQHIAWAKAI